MPGREERQRLIPSERRRMPGFAHLVPLLLVSWSSAAFIICYAIAVLDGHVESLFPYIRNAFRVKYEPFHASSGCFNNTFPISVVSCAFPGDTGTMPPESGIFGFMINVSAFLGAVTMYMKYLIIKEQNEVSHFISPCFNLLALCIGILGCIGLGIVASFQELTVPTVHDGGALVAFVSGALYILLQTIISYRSCPQWCTRCTCHTRLFLSVMTSVAIVPMIACASLISITKIDWNPGEKDYVYHFVSAVCEWTVAFGFVMFFLTFIKEFQRATIQITTEIHEVV